MSNTQTQTKNPPTAPTHGEWKAVSRNGQTEFVHASGFRTTSAQLVSELRERKAARQERGHSVTLGPSTTKPELQNLDACVPGGKHV